MRIYRITDIGEAEAGTPVTSPSGARRVLYYLHRRANRAASDDMIVSTVFGGDKNEAQIAISKCVKANAIRVVGG